MDSNAVNRMFYKDLNDAIKNIQITNYKEIVLQKLAPYIKEVTLNKEGYLITDLQAFEQAHQLFLQGKEAGKIDELNSIIPNEEYING